MEGVEPVFHSVIGYFLPEGHELEFEVIFCDRCAEMVKLDTNECIKSWIESEVGNHCTECLDIDNLIDFIKGEGDLKFKTKEEGS